LFQSEASFARNFIAYIIFRFLLSMKYEDEIKAKYLNPYLICNWYYIFQ
jgi:hypothetical protein